MATRQVFCCSKIEPYRAQQLDHERKFTAFMTWADRVTSSLTSNENHTPVSGAPYAVQIVRQINFGPQEWIRYFIPGSGETAFAEVTEDDLLEANFKKLNSYKNFRCAKHNRFFEVNIYQKDAINTHHWRATLSRPSRDIDLSFREKGTKAKPDKAEKGTERVEQPLPSTSNPETSTTRREVVERETGTRASEDNREPATQLDLVTLKNTLCLLLPAVRTNVSSDHILFLLSLDWINKELALGLDLETQWDAELDTTNIMMFLCHCFDMRDGDSVDLSDIEELVIPAMRHVEHLGKHQLLGRDRLQKIVDHILEHNPTVDWVSKYGSTVALVLASAPNEELLEQCRRRHNEVQNRQRIEAEHDRNIGTDEGNIGFYAGDRDGVDDFDYDDHRYDYDYDDRESSRDFTACDKECGYCGHCDY
ncbi:hypothetical protein BGZ63DRAFT_465138 [Mariannaea sp. PMI_226]|nr:hypothetical protein BGZ63DRAFT_465138 [Mariannaea sp. PMI_226]